MLKRRRLIFSLLAIAPVIAIFAYVRMFPIGEIFRLSLHKWDILSKNKPFIGLANFQELFGDRLFQAALINTSIIAFGVLLITVPLAMVLAALLLPHPLAVCWFLRNHHLYSARRLARARCHGVEMDFRRAPWAAQCAAFDLRH